VSWSQEFDEVSMRGMIHVSVNRVLGSRLSQHVSLGRVSVVAAGKMTDMGLGT
jgi:hypothetical protein